VENAQQCYADFELDGLRGQLHRHERRGLVLRVHGKKNRDRLIELARRLREGGR